MGYDAVADEDYLVISEEMSKELPHDIPKDELDSHRNQPMDIDEFMPPQGPKGGTATETLPNPPNNSNEFMPPQGPQGEIAEESYTLEESNSENARYYGVTGAEENVPVTPVDPYINVTETSILTPAAQTENTTNSNSFSLLDTENFAGNSRSYSGNPVELVPVYDFWNNDDQDHTFHLGDPWDGETKGNVQYYVYPEQVEGTEPVYLFYNEAYKDHTIHFGDAWAGEVKYDQIQFYTYPEAVEGLNLEPVYSFWHRDHLSHTFHLGDPWNGELREDKIVFYAVPVGEADVAPIIS